MNLFGALLSRALDAVDICFEALSALWRVVLRGAFAPDAKSYRSPRFGKLASGDVLAQEIALNANDQSEAKKAVGLDAERLLPLAPELIAYDVAGPLKDDGRPRARPERPFILGVVRRDALQDFRENLSAAQRGSVEAFVFVPPLHPDQALVFEDEAGKRRRRTRRATLALALFILTLTANDALRAATAMLERGTAAADAERLAVERRIRLADRRSREAEAARTALAQYGGPPLAEVSARLSRIALHQPEDAELSTVTFERRTLSLSGRSYTPDGAELALRRAFEGEEISFRADDGEPPRAFEARLTFAPEAHP